MITDTDTDTDTEKCDCKAEAKFYCEECIRFLCKEHLDQIHELESHDPTICIKEYYSAKASLSSPPGENENDNKLINIFGKDNDSSIGLEMGKKLAKDDEAPLNVISFVGAPDTGKSTLIKRLLLLNNQPIAMTPLINDPNAEDATTQTSDITGYKSTIGGFDTLLVDTESGGYDIPRTAQSVKSEERKTLVHGKHPQFVYNASDIVVFVVNHHRSNLIAVIELVLAYTQVATSENLPKSTKPHLIVVFNKMEPYLGGSNKWYRTENGIKTLFDKNAYNDYPLGGEILKEIEKYYKSQQAIVIPDFLYSSLGYIEQTKALFHSISSITSKYDIPDFESTFQPLIDYLNIKKIFYCDKDGCSKPLTNYCKTCAQFLCDDTKGEHTKVNHQVVSITDYKQEVYKGRHLLQSIDGKLVLGPMWSTLSLMSSKNQGYYLVSFLGQNVGAYADETMFPPPVSSDNSFDMRCYVEYPNTVNQKRIMMIDTDNSSNQIYRQTISLISDIIVVVEHGSKEEITSTIKSLTEKHTSKPHIILIHNQRNDLEKLKEDLTNISFIDQSLQKSIEDVLKKRESSNFVALRELELFVDKYNYYKCKQCSNQATCIFTGTPKCEDHFNALVQRFKDMCIPIDKDLESRSILKHGDYEQSFKKEYDARNKLFKERDGTIEFGPKWYQCGLDNDQEFKMVTFIGPSGSGKSTLIRGLCHGDRPLLPEENNQFSSTSSDINVYLGKTPSSGDFLIADCEGFGGTLNTATSTGGASKSHRTLVETEYPRIMHSFSDVVVCVCSNSWQERQTIGKYVKLHAQHSDAGIVNQGELPHLILVFNKKAKNEMNVGNEEATKEFFDNYNGEFKKIVRPYYRSWNIIRIATDEGGKDPKTFLASYQALKDEIYKHLFEKDYKLSKQTIFRNDSLQGIVASPLTTKEVIKQMGEVVHRFNSNVSQINFIEIQPIDPRRVASYLFKYFRVAFSLLLSTTDKLGAYEKSIDLLSLRLSVSNIQTKIGPQFYQR
ncbi:hypothetical protein DFA_11948 [Cavenderia fasciculata]|uniref:B box-type domain-containing protein n=1 Tax=Cavenderia fasciculata TaxID=261658 RepID=F4QEX2_CACFS|nr:uncharacterized protein DFA_11948 [Cavenderia fasciculata]EGG14179.1 hypothetical protein DFA_11948 [Cavenderia fasciculata]|eukprot:XP_004350887.1 hypothetical protein DFA_11948 [Cavenderia fasciculata]